MHWYWYLILAVALLATGAILIWLFRKSAVRAALSESLRWCLAFGAGLLLLVAILDAIIPAMFFFSQEGTAPYWWLRSVTFGVTDMIGQFATTYVLCPFSHCVHPSDGATPAHTETLFQALFGFGLATGSLVQLRKLSTRALRRLENKLDSKFKSFSPGLFRDEDKANAQKTRDAWEPRFNLLVRWTFNACLIGFYLTAAVAALMMIETLIVNDFKIFVHWPLSVSFALAPFISVLLLFLHFLMCNSVVERGIAPGLYYRTARARDRSQVISQIAADTAAIAAVDPLEPPAVPPA